jgi:hypothetical protein
MPGYNEVVMSVNIVATLTALEAEANASLFLSDRVPDRLMACDPRLDERSETWRVKVALAYPVTGSIGEVGEIIINARSGEIISHTPLDEMLSRARALYDEHRDAIEAGFS